ncbi:MAG: hypothetical protein OEV66_09890 [Spirochaetia bacterium]|nr:hypothetical protein [Spirochaetia bacterium]
MTINNYSSVSVEDFSGGAAGIAPGACGLFAIHGNCTLPNVFASAQVLQYRARNGAGAFLKGFYRDDEHYHFHIMYRERNKITELEDTLENMGIHFLDKRPLVRENLYFEYDMPVFLSYTALTPSEDLIKHKGGKGGVHDFIRDRVILFNLRNRDNARIFSSSLNGANFSTAFELNDTIRIFDLEQYSDKLLTGVLVHMRWPTSQGNGVWWGAQPIVHGNFAGIHNGHLSSDKSNARALEQLGIPMQVGTDSEAIFQETYYLLEQGLSLEEIEWLMIQKFPAETKDIPVEKKQKYFELTSDPVLKHFKMSGPSTAIINYGDIMLGMTDRDHMRQFTVGFNDNIAVFASEERAIVTYADASKTGLKILSPPAGKLIAFLAQWNENIKKGIKSVKILENNYIHVPQNVRQNRGEIK